MWPPRLQLMIDDPIQENIQLVGPCYRERNFEILFVKPPWLNRQTFLKKKSNTFADGPQAIYQPSFSGQLLACPLAMVLAGGWLSSQQPQWSQAPSPTVHPAPKRAQPLVAQSDLWNGQGTASPFCDHPLHASALAWLNKVVETIIAKWTAMTRSSRNSWSARKFAVWSKMSNFKTLGSTSKLSALGPSPCTKGS